MPTHQRGGRRATAGPRSYAGFWCPEFLATPMEQRWRSLGYSNRSDYLNALVALDLGVPVPSYITNNMVDPDQVERQETLPAS